jgi:hypothetical protein
MMLLNLLPSHLELVSGIILAATKTLGDMKFDECCGAIIGAWHNPHSVANVAQFNQPGQQKPQWQHNTTAGPSGPSPQKFPQKQQLQGNQLKPTTQKAPGDREMKQKKTCGKGKGKVAAIEEVPSGYQTASMITCPVIAIPMGFENPGYNPKALSTCSVVEQIQLENRAQTIGTLPISTPITGACSHSKNRKTQSDERIVYLQNVNTILFPQLDPSSVDPMDSNVSDNTYKWYCWTS